MPLNAAAAPVTVWCMKRRWRPGRILLAVLLTGIASMTAYHWAKQPRWQLATKIPWESNHIVSVDEAKRLLYLRYMDFSAMEDPKLGEPGTPLKLVFETRCYNLDTGKLIWTHPDPAEITASSDGMPSMCQVIISPDNRQLIYLDSQRGRIHFYALPPRQKRTDIHFTQLSPGEHLRASFSPKGDWLIARTNRQIFVYDAQTAKLLHQLDIPKEYIIEGGRGSWNLEQDALLSSTDQRYVLMTNNNAENILFFEMQGKKVIGEAKNVCLPHLLNDGKALVCFPEYFNKESQAYWYQFRETSIDKLNVTTTEAVEGVFICCNDKHFLTVKPCLSADPPFWSEWTWLPESTKLRIAQWLGLLNFQIEASLWNITTGALDLRIPMALSANDGLPSGGHRCWLLKDSTQMLFNIGTSISLWDLPPRRPPACWLTVASVFLLSLWLAWPRRVKPTTLAASPHAGK